MVKLARILTSSPLHGTKSPLLTVQLPSFSFLSAEVQAGYFAENDVPPSAPH